MSSCLESYAKKYAEALSHKEICGVLFHSIKIDLKVLGGKYTSSSARILNSNKWNQLLEERDSGEPLECTRHP